MGKIFGIGLSKTGTSSLARALEILGYRTKDYLGVVRYTPGDLSSIDRAVLDANDAFTDTPIPSFYRELDKCYPGSKFILTVRERDGWLKSCRKQFNQRLAQRQTEAHRRLFLDLYGTDVFEESQFIRGYEMFVAGVNEYFGGRQDDLLVMDIAAGDGWDKLCTFLGTSVPDVPFPKANVTHVRWLDLSAVAAVAREAGMEISRVHGDAVGNGSTASLSTRDGSSSARGVLNWLERTIVRTAYSLRGGDTGAVRTAAALSNAAIARGLRKLTPEIPIVSRLRTTITDAERVRSNHVWLVDPFAVAPRPPHRSSGPAVCIALVEDGLPICGVVYDSSEEKLYYGQAGKGSFVVGIDGVARPLGRTHDDAPGVEPAGEPAPMPAPGTQMRARDATCAGMELPPSLAMCRVAEGAARSYSCAETTAEWEVAAGDAIARAAGKQIREEGSGSELRYNKKEMTQQPFAVW
jgi:3'-phosphoadenosine 5'-phosphosulfate (PAPS) 3'-phosphatase